MLMTIAMVAITLSTLIVTLICVLVIAQEITSGAHDRTTGVGDGAHDRRCCPDVGSVGADSRETHGMTDLETVPVGTMQSLKAMEEERDALAAHVERLRDVLWRIADTSNAIQCRELAGDAYDESTPDTSLAHLKAQWQAEAYDLSANLVKLEGPDDSRLIAFRKKLSTRLDGIAAEVRRQAEETP